MRQRIPIVVGALAAFAVVAVVVLSTPRTFTSSASFLPQSRRSTPTVNGLAAQLGLSLPTTEGTQTPAFYVDLVHAPQILESMISTVYTFRTDTGAVSEDLFAAYRIPPGTAAVRTDAAKRKLTGAIEASVNQRTSVIRIDVTASNAELATQMNRKLLELVNKFNLETRRSQASAERQFTQSRVAEIKRDLEAAEEDLRDFQARNQNVGSSASLRLELDRKQRAVALEQTLFTSIAQAYEQAKIEEVRDTPLITVIDEPEPPVRPDSRQAALKGLLALFFGGMIGLFIGSARRHYAGRLPKDWNDFRTVASETLEDGKHPVAAIRRALRRP